jgi:hypothetical protein
MQYRVARAVGLLVLLVLSTQPDARQSRRLTIRVGDAFAAPGRISDA